MNDNRPIQGLGIVVESPTLSGQAEGQVVDSVEILAISSFQLPEKCGALRNAGDFVSGVFPHPFLQVRGFYL